MLRPFDVLCLFLIAFITWLAWLILVPPKRLYEGNNLPVIQSRFQGLGAVGFFANRYHFLTRSMTKDPSHPHAGIAKFNLLGKIVYTVGGNDEPTLRAIALNKDLSFSQGNAFLFAGIPGAGQKGLTDDGEMDTEEKKEMKALAMAISPNRLGKMIPTMAHDVFEEINTWFNSPSSKESTLVDLQKGYYPLIFKFTLRLMGLTEFVSSRPTMIRIQKAFWQTQLNSGFFTTLTPWLPQPRLFVRLYGAVTLWWMVRQGVKKRRDEGRREDDWAQELIDDKQGVDSISRWVIGGLLAGILNTIGTGAYTLAFIGADPTLKTRVMEDIHTSLRTSAEARGDIYEDLTPLEAIQRVSLPEWESSFPLLHACFKESIRLLLTNSLNRYYPGPSTDRKTGKQADRLKLGGQDIEDDVYITFSPPSNLHDEEAFEDAWRFDPDRYEKRGEGSTEYTYVGWGVGHHRCTGMRFAKMETILAITTVFLHCDITTVNDEDEPYLPFTGAGLRNGEGDGGREVPLPDLSQGHWRAPRKPMRVRATRR